ncbi:MAG: phosphoribosylformylglycinamidine synthase subunit PurQ, partial [Gammaproteobacteria bacterium]
PQRVVQFFNAQRALRANDLLLAYHDRSDGGLFTTLVEMAFAAHAGLEIEVPTPTGDVLGYLFAEELGAVVQVKADDLDEARRIVSEHGIDDCPVVARVASHGDVVIRLGEQQLFKAPRVRLHRWWSELTFRLQRLRDHPECAQEAYDTILDEGDPGLDVSLTFIPPEFTAPPRDSRPKIAVLREQGVNGQREMAAAFDRAGFEAHDVHMTDLLSGRTALAEFRGLVACGGFSYGDVLGAGEGWAKSILYNEPVRAQFVELFAREDVFILGVCNGCQMLAALKDLIPGAGHWPRFVRNRSDQFEARLSLVRIEPSPSVLLTDMVGSRLPIVTSHGEGRAEFASDDELVRSDRELASLRYVDNRGDVAERYPANPNGSPRGIAGLTNEDGRVTIMMPHPERVFRTVQHSWHPPDWGENSPWQKLFANARDWLDSNA